MDCICNYPTEEPDEDNNDGNFRLFTYRELNSATRGFHPSEKIGEGGFGTVYKVIHSYILSLFSCGY